MQPRNLPGLLQWETGPNGLARARITGAQADAVVYRHGAHVAEFQPHGQRPVLFLSGRSWYEPGKPIRGGIPVIFPWFGPHPTDANQPAHGTVRLGEWDFEGAEGLVDGGVQIALGTTAAGCRLQLRVKVAAALEVALEVRNTSPAAVRFEEALHTYFAVSDCRQCSVTGLDGGVYSSGVEAVTGKQAEPGPIRFTREFDRLYMNTQATCVLHDAGWQRRIIVEKSGSDCTVVWNPWIDKSKRMPDFGDDEWPGMVCIETVNAREHSVTLPPGRSHTMMARVRVEAAG